MIISKNVHVVIVFDHEESYEEIFSYCKQRFPIYLLDGGFFTYMGDKDFEDFVAEFEVEF